jgi:hypothetical protein
MKRLLIALILLPAALCAWDKEAEFAEWILNKLAREEKQRKLQEEQRRRQEAQRQRQIQQEKFRHGMNG